MLFQSSVISNSNLEPQPPSSIKKRSHFIDQLLNLQDKSESTLLLYQACRCGTAIVLPTHIYRLLVYPWSYKTLEYMGSLTLLLSSLIQETRQSTSDSSYHYHYSELLIARFQTIQLYRLHTCLIKCSITIKLIKQKAN